jgi:putative PEP-CTERM system TPR-repeat lipoprotein
MFLLFTNGKLMNRITVLLLLLIIISCSEQSPASHIFAAKQHIEQQQLQSAIIELKNAVKLDANSSEARFLLGKTYIDNKQYLAAEKELSRALELDYPKGMVVPLLSLAFQKTQADVALLELSYKNAELSTEQVIEIAFYQLQASVRLEKTERAEALINEIKNYTIESPYKKLALVYAFLLKNDVEAAQLQLRAMLVETPKQTDALKLQGFLYASSGDLINAIASYKAYLALVPDDLDATFVTARLLTDVNQTEEAEPLVDALLTINNSNNLLNQLKGIARFNAEDSENALIYTEKALLNNPEDPGLRLIAGYSAYMQEDYQLAHKHLSIIADRLPPSHQGLRILAISQLNLGLSVEAGDTANLLEQVSSKDSSLISSIGLALVQSGEINKARELLIKNEQTEMTNAEDLTRLGLLQLSLNDVNGIANLEMAFDQAPDEEATKNTLATAYLASGQTEKALLLAQRWKNTDSSDTSAFMLAGLAYFNDKQYQKAKQEFTQLLTIDKTHQRAQLSLIEIAEQQEQPELVKQGVEKLLSEQPDFIPALIKLYVHHKQAGKVNDAMKRIEEQYLAQQDNIALALLWSKILVSEDKANEGIGVLESFSQKGDLPASYWQVLGNAYIKNKDNNKAIVHYQKWLEALPNSREAIVGNLLVLDQRGQYQQGLALTKEYLDKSKDDQYIRLLNTHFLLQLGDFTQARLDFDLLPKAVQELPFSKGLLGQLQLQNKNYGDALTNLQKAYEAIPSSKNMRLVYATFLNSDNSEAGYDFVKKHVELKPNDLAAIMILANAQISLDKSAAIDTYEKALSLNPKNVVALNNLAYFYLEKNELDKALDFGKRALALNPDMADVLDTLARVYMANNDFETAVNYLNKAISNGEVSEEIYLNYVEALVLSDDKVLATRKLNQREFKQPESLKKIAFLKSSYAM